MVKATPLILDMLNAFEKLRDDTVNFDILDPHDPFFTKYDYRDMYVFIEFLYECYLCVRGLGSQLPCVDLR